MRPTRARKRQNAGYAPKKGANSVKECPRSPEDSLGEPESPDVQLPGRGLESKPGWVPCLSDSPDSGAHRNPVWSRR